MTGIEIELGDLGNGGHQQPDPLDDLDDRLDRNRGAAASPLQQREHPKSLDRSAGL